MYNPFVDTADVATFLRRYCTEVCFSHLVKGGQGHWNGKRKFFVKLRQDPDGIGGFLHPLSNFAIGQNRGYLFYSGMPLYCCNCARFGHTKDTCSEDKQARCNKCGQPGHIASAYCPQKAKKGAGPKPSSGSEQRPTAVAGPAMTIPKKASEPSMLAVKRTPIKKAVPERRSSIGLEKDSTALAEDTSRKALSLRRRSSGEAGQEMASSSAALVPSRPAGTLAVGPEPSAMKVQGAVEPEQVFAVPSTEVPARRGEGTSRRASEIGLKVLEQEVKALSALSSAMTIPDAPEKWVAAESKKKVRRSQRRKSRAEAQESSATEESGVEDPEGRKPKEKATGAALGKKEASKRPAEKRLKSEVSVRVQKMSSCSSEGECREMVDPQHVSSSDPVNIVDPASPEQGEEGSLLISYESSVDSDMDTIAS
ncbi:hypothetical protein XELAEV_18040935mg [Xenopus laevis]|uniref:Zinc finger CCHC domain-containing protein n=1 Tax=Xenopus laevis TaxID=8355 RepID=A0A974CAN8_XENLA|nr:hypothetical protein XELAEV_18040935mg [Xenopus laevis]